MSILNVPARWPRSSAHDSFVKHFSQNSQEYFTHWLFTTPEGQNVVAGLLKAG